MERQLGDGLDASEVSVERECDSGPAGRHISSHHSPSDELRFFDMMRSSVYVESHLVTRRVTATFCRNMDSQV